MPLVPAYESWPCGTELLLCWRILQDLDGGQSWNHCEWQQLKLHVFKLSVLLRVDKYESPNAGYQSDRHPILMIFGSFRILQQSWRLIRQYHVKNITFSGASLLKSRHVCSQYKRGRRIRAYKGEIQHRERTVKVRWRLRGNRIDSSSPQSQDCEQFGYK